ncbi:hypothetical protein GGF40_001100 [Coemansia sp. RSA 1286]|nr:hypothetical protein GGF39_001050 [Coemansia sp. RSA 1721]KAJ2639146.1 hypothetical protein GGF40_001100 [Coemansia sp. RSA 1286]
MLSEENLNILAQVKAQDIALSALDLANFGIILDGVYFYKNEQSSQDFMSIEKLQHSFCKIVADYYPIVVGLPTIDQEGNALIKVDPANLCIPDIQEMTIQHPAEAFFESRPSDIKGNPDVLFFNTRKFYRESGAELMPKANYQKENSGVVIRIIRFKDSPYVAFSFSLSHGIFDGIGAMVFINHWAEYTRNLADVDAGNYKLADPPLNDRQIFHDSLKDVEALKVPYIDYFKENVPPLPFELPENPAAALINIPDIPVCEEQHMLHFSSKTLNRMRNDVDPAHTINTVLAAFIAKNMLLANIEVFGTTPLLTCVAIAYDSRLRSDIPQQYSGNASCISVAPISSQKVLDGTYQDLANELKEHSARNQSGHTKTFLDILENDMKLMFQTSLSLCNTPASSYVGMTNVRYMPFYTIDFGYGKPGILGFDYYMREGMIRVLPNSQDGGVDLVVNFRDEFFEKLCNLEDVKKYADVIY